MRITVISGQILHGRRVYQTGEALEAADDIAKLLIARGLAEAETVKAEKQEASLEGRTVKELTDYAAEHHISVPAGTPKKADLIAVIRAAESGQLEEENAEDNSGEGPETEMPEE